ELNEVDAGDMAEEGSGLGAHALAVGEVAGVVVGDADGEIVAGGDRAELDEEFGDVADAAAEFGEAGGVDRIVTEDLGVFLHAGAVAGGVDDDGVELLFEEDVDEVARHLAGAVAVAEVEVEGA